MSENIPNTNQNIEKIPKDDYYIPNGIAIDCQLSQPAKYLHYHNFIEFFYIIDGNIEHNFNGSKKILIPGDFAVIDIDSYHSLTPINNTPCKLINLLFKPSFLDISLSDTDDITKIFKCREFQYKCDISKDTINTVYHENDDKIKKILMDMQSEYFHSEFGYLKVLKARLIEILIHFVRYMNPQSLATTSSVIDIALNYIEKNFYKKIALEEISNLLHFTPQYFSSKFKKETGYSFTQYLQKIRINKSCHLLQNTNMKVSEISEAVGYSDILYYEKIFKKYINRTPLQYRKFGREKTMLPQSKKHGHMYFNPDYSEYKKNKE